MDNYKLNQHPVKRSLRYSFIDGCFFSVMFGFGDTYLNPYIIALKATPQEVGLLTSLPGFASSILQYKTPDITKLWGRKRTMVTSVFLHALMWLPILLIPFIFQTKLALWLVGFVTLYTMFTGLGGPAWASIMTQYIPNQSRGKYFSFRNKWLGSITLISSFIAGIILWLMNKKSIYGFTIIFSIAFLCRFISWYFITKYYEPKIHTPKEAEFGLKDFLIRFKESNFVKFVLYVAFTSFAVYLAAPFFAVYMLRELKFDYLSFVVINTTLTITMLLTLSTWGNHADKVGNMSVIRLAGFMLPFLPVLWLFSTSKIYLVCINALAGFAWAGFNLAVSNFIFDAVSPEKRVRCISYFNLINGTGVCLGALIGGFVIPHLPQTFGSKILTVFVISGILRFVAQITLLPKVKEVRKTVSVKSKDLFFSVLGIKPIIGIPQDTIRIE
ncbi:MAG: MFS transporter [Elusimicrobiota bacterium]